MYSSKRRLFPILFVSALPCAIFAQSDINDVIQVYGQTYKNPANYNFIGRDEFLKYGTRLSDVLKRELGLQIRQAGGIGSQVAVSLRGSTHKQVQFYIDGQLINDGQSGGFDINQLPLEQIQSIEISKSQAVENGATPIGGVIKITTYDPVKNQRRASVSLGSFDYYQANLLTSQNWAEHQLTASLSHLDANNDYPYPVHAPLDDAQDQGRMENLRNNDFRRSDIYLNHSVNWQQHSFKSSYQFNDELKRLPSYRNNSPYNHSRLSTQSHRISFKDQWLSQSDVLHSIHFEAYGQNKNERYFDRSERDKNERSDYQTDDQAVNVSALFKLPAVELSPYLKLSNSRFISDSFANKQGDECTGINACDVIAVQKQFNFGVRYDWPQQLNSPWGGHLLVNELISLDENRVRQTLRPNFEVKTANSRETYFTFDAGLSYLLEPGSGSQISLNYADGVRTPSMFERYGNRGLLKGNAELAAEQSKTLSLSYFIAPGAWQFNSTLYQRALENSITAIFNSSGIGTYLNIGDADVYGLEFGSRYQFNKHWIWSANASWLDSKTQGGPFDGKYLPGIYHQQYFTELAYQPMQHLKFTASVSHDNKLYFSRANLVGPEGPAKRTVADFSARFEHGAFSFALQALNIFNQHYQDLANRAAVGRSFKLTITYEDTQ
ncbi:TonB-dependent receptor [Gayadomonas joobiniege]|uniref:TonB-dependent receptor n=1 Tax=Gayadomonas joobiniege TaxID=1234606 RepID=UPI000365E6D0|nr:TonB-dependent receptor [Gayadomonas joobiniege]